MKTQDQYFADWEASLFGYGYGTGEGHVLGALKRFMEIVPQKRAYNYLDLECELGPVIAWLLINDLCHADILEYGTSPRFAWLTPRGDALKSYLATKSVDDLVAVCEKSDEYCYPDHCNCEGEECHNPFWRPLQPRGRNT